MTNFLLATGNPHKVEEIRQILGDQFRYFTLEDIPKAPPVSEDASSFAGNAAKKAEQLAGWLAAHPQAVKKLGKVRTVGAAPQLYVLADDSGLEVDALQGAPGVYSARFAAGDPAWQKTGDSADQANNRKLMHLLREVPWEQRTARFRCVIALTPVLIWVKHNQGPVQGSENGFQTELFEGTCEGRIALEPRGDQGFGYDPLFIPENSRESFAELDGAAKNQMSHRGRALARLHIRFA